LFLSLSKHIGHSLACMHVPTCDSPPHKDRCSMHQGGERALALRRFCLGWRVGQPRTFPFCATLAMSLAALLVVAFVVLLRVVALLLSTKQCAKVPECCTSRAEMDGCERRDRSLRAETLQSYYDYFLLLELRNFRRGARTSVLCASLCANEHQPINPSKNCTTTNSKTQSTDSNQLPTSHDGSLITPQTASSNINQTRETNSLIANTTSQSFHQVDVAF
jgi:hypothetical protein